MGEIGEQRMGLGRDAVSSRFLSFLRKVLAGLGAGICSRSLYPLTQRSYRPFFKKSERFKVPDKAYQERHQAYFDQEYHGTDGPLHTIYATEYAENNKYWHETLNNVGVDSNRSHLSGFNVGCWTSLAGVDPESQQRCYSARAYYLPASERKNLSLLTEAMVRDVVIEKEGDEWVTKGVRFVHQGKEYITKVEGGEVILSCGSVQSPQLLELSGIGNPEILKAAGIETKVANPNVGENLQEHMCRPFGFAFL